MIGSLLFFVFLELSVTASFSIGWIIWFLLSYFFYIKRTKSLKKLALSLAFLFWVVIVAGLYSRVPVSKLKRPEIISHFLIFYLSVLYYFSLNFVANKVFFSFKNHRIKVDSFRSFFYWSVFFISSIYFFSRDFSYWWVKNLLFYFFLLIFFNVYLKRFSFSFKVILSFLFLELVIAFSFLSVIPELKAFLVSLIFVSVSFLLGEKKYLRKP